MPKDRDDQLNSGLPPDGLEFSLEEILAEYEVKERRPADDAVPLPLDGRGKRAKVLHFPGTPPAQDGAPATAPGPDTPEPEPDAPDPAPPERDAPAPPPKRRLGFGKKEAPPPPPRDEKVLPFPEEEEENPVAAGINRLKRKADDYAEHMFEEEGAEDDEQVRRAERFIPGVDEEEAPQRERKPRRAPPPAPDLPPQELFRRYGKGLKALRLRCVLVFLTCIPLLYLTLAPYAGLPLPAAVAREYTLQIYALAILLGVCMLLGVDVLLRGLLSIFRLQLGMDSLTAFACIASLADALTMPALGGRDGHLPYCAITALGLFFAMRGTYRKRRGQRAACRTAASASEPYLVTLDDGKWNGRDTYAKWSGEPIGFGRQIQAADGAERIFRVAAPLLLLCCALFSGLASVGRGRTEDLLWCLSATLTAAASFSGALCFGMPWSTLAQRLSKSGAALAGWDGVVGTGGGSYVLLTDADLFPPGTISMNGIKVFGDFPVEKVIGCAATLVRDSGSGLDKVFHDLLRSQGAIYRRASDFCCYEGGGVSGVIRDQVVLVGSASFMHLMEVDLPQGLNVKNAVFCAIDGELAGIFALHYSLHGAVEPALHALIHNGVLPVLATRDFNLIPAMLRQRFKLPVEKMEFPAVERRVELSDPDQEHSPILSAVLCREGLGPYSEAVVGGQRLRRAVRASAVLASVGAFIGVLLAFYLTFSGAYSSLSPANLLVFLLMWLVPTPLISGWVNRY